MIPDDLAARLLADPDAVTQPEVREALGADPVAQRYLTLFAPINWAAVPERTPRRAYPGPVPHPYRSAVQALIVKVLEQRRSGEALRTYLCEHPALTVVLGFRPVPDPQDPTRIDWGRTVPSARWFRQHAHDRADEVRALLTQTVRAAQRLATDPGLVVAIDTTHIVAHVRENNPKRASRRRWGRGHRPSGDRDCRLGAKVLSNQAPGRRKTYLYGYGCGCATSPITVAGARHDLVLAIHVLPFNAQDIRFFRPLSQGATAALGAPFTHLAADAAFDAWYVYAQVAETGGIAAIAPNPRSTPPPRTAEGHPYCAQQHPMRPTSVGQHEDGYPVQRYACPLKGPTAPVGVSCVHPRFARGGCSKRLNIAPGSALRTTIDRTDPAFKTIYAQRTCVERSNSQAKVLGLERPLVRSLAAVTTQALATAAALNLTLLARLIPVTAPTTT